MSGLIEMFLIFFCGLAITVPTTSANQVIKLSSGHEMPIIGLGTFLLESKDIDLAVTTALNTGYKLIDTAFIYKNEEAIGKTLKKWFDKGGKREEIFITTKLPPFGNKASEIEKYLKLSLEKLGLQYVDLFLIHTPVGIFKDKDKDQVAYDKDENIILDYETDHISMWKAMEAQVKAGRTKSIGLSNFNESQILNVLNNAEIKPSNLQVELQIYYQQKPLRELCAQHNISVTSYSTLGSPGSIKNKNVTEPLKHPIVQQIAKNHKKTTAQVLLRHAIQNGLLVIPKSKTPKRIQENFNIFDFSLTNDEMKQLNDLDKGELGRKFNFLSFKGIQKHPEYPFSNEISKA